MAVRISFPISSKCSCCPNLLAASDTRYPDDLTIFCTLDGKCPINMERNWAICSVKTVMKNNSPFIKKL